MRHLDALDALLRELSNGARDAFRAACVRLRAAVALPAAGLRRRAAVSGALLRGRWHGHRHTWSGLAAWPAGHELQLPPSLTVPAGHWLHCVRVAQAESPAAVSPSGQKVPGFDARGQPGGRATVRIPSRGSHLSRRQKARRRCGGPAACSGRRSPGTGRTASTSRRGTPRSGRPPAARGRRRTSRRRCSPTARWPLSGTRTPRRRRRTRSTGRSGTRSSQQSRAAGRRCSASTSGSPDFLRTARRC
jgi:hypothetical protein